MKTTILDWIKLNSTVKEVLLLGLENTSKPLSWLMSATTLSILRSPSSLYPDDTFNIINPIITHFIKQSWLNAHLTYLNIDEIKNYKDLACSVIYECVVFNISLLDRVRVEFGYNLLFYLKILKSNRLVFFKFDDEEKNKREIHFEFHRYFDIEKNKLRNLNNCQFLFE